MSDIVEHDEEVMAELDVYRLGVIMETHARSMACHCECLAMNAENMWAAILNETPKYYEADYHRIMQKWGLLGVNGEPLI